MTFRSVCEASARVAAPWRRCRRAGCRHGSGAPCLFRGFHRQAIAGRGGPWLIADGGLLLVSSTRRVWVVGSDLEPLERLDPIGPLADVPEVRGHGITIREYDLEDPAGGYLEEEWAWPDSGDRGCGLN
jgi:hypothetical protein